VDQPRNSHCGVSLRTPVYETDGVPDGPDGVAGPRGHIKRLDERVARLEHSQAKLEGLLEGLREAITRQPAARTP